jgi:hypothetical protein
MRRPWFPGDGVEPLPDVIAHDLLRLKYEELARGVNDLLNVMEDLGIVGADDAEAIDIAILRLREAYA